MAKKRRYTGSFKVQALELAASGQNSSSAIEREVGITAGLLDKWTARMKEDGPHALPGQGGMKEDEELIRRLKREVEVVRQARDILKKALAIFSARTEKSSRL